LGTIQDPLLDSLFYLFSKGTCLFSNKCFSFKKLISLLEEEASIQGIELVSQSPSKQDRERVHDIEISDISSVVQGFMDADSHRVDIDTIKKYMWVGEQLYKKSCEIEKNILCYEDNIRRHYFHVKPLDDSQLENWHRYLDFVETQGDFDWV
jgi:pre-mRNA-processing factor 39